jgi:phage head maturation protease
MKQTAQIPALSMRASFTPSTVNAEKRTVEVVWTTGAPVLRGYYDRFWEELSLDPKHVRMDRLNNGAPFLADHDAYRVADTLGVVESAKVDGKRGTAVVRFPAEGIDPEADKVFRKIQDGIIQNVSVGYRIYKMEETVAGQDGIPVRKAIDWEPHEISAVAVGADDGAGFRSADESKTNVCEFINRGEAPHTERSKMNEEEIKRAAEEKAKAEAAEKQRKADLEAEAKRAAQAERERVLGIEHAVRACGLDDAFSKHHVEAGTKLEDVRKLALDAAVKRQEENPIDGTTRFEVTTDVADKFKQGAEAWILERTGALQEIQRAQKLDSYNAKLEMRGLGKVSSGAGEFRGATLSDLARRFLEMNHQRVRTFDPVKLFEAAYNYRSGYGTVSDFAVLLENILYKTLLAGYETMEDTWSRFCGTKEVKDFRPANFYRTGSFGVLPALNEHGEYENTAIPDGAKYSVSVGSYGDIIAITRQLIINDDMGALTEIALQRGRDARSTIEDKVFTLLSNGGAWLGPTQSDSQPFFHNNRLNVNAVASANTEAGWDADAQIMAAQKDVSGNKTLSLVPSVLLLPRARYLEAKKLNASTVKVGGSNSEPNMAQGAAQDIVWSPRLSGTRRYWFANPATNPAIVVGFLAGGGSAPTLSSEQAFRVDGVQMKTAMDFGVGFIDGKCAVTNAGL